MSQSHVEEHYDKTIFGFWIYLITDFVLFAAYFATYAVLQHRTFGAPHVITTVYMPCVVWRTLILLLGAFTAGITGVQAHKRNRGGTIFWTLVTMACGAIFFAMQFSEFAMLFERGMTWQRSAALSAFYNVIGVLLIHIVFAFIWSILFLISIWKNGVDDTSVRRMTCLRMLWQFINIIWVFIFSIVYVMGVVK